MLLRSSRGLLPQSVMPGSREPAGGTRRLECDEIGVLRLIDLHAGDEVVAEAKVQRQAARNPPVVLHVCGVLLERNVDVSDSAVARDGLDRSVPFVGQVDVEVVVDAAVEGRKQVRLVDEVDAGLEVVAEAALAGDAPGEIVAELPLRLLGVLRRIRVRADGDAVGEDLQRVGAAERDRILEAGELDHDFVQLCVPAAPSCDSG